MHEDLLLFYSPNGCSLGSVVVCEWIGLPYRLCRVEKHEHECAAYRELNPLGYTPLLRHQGRTIAENIAILHHLNTLDTRTGFRFGSAEFDRMNHALAVLATGLHVAFTPFFHVDRFADEATCQATVQRVALSTLRRKLAYIESHLTPPGFLFGRPTLIEAFLFGIVRWADALLDWRALYPNIARCQDALAQEPAVQFALGREEQRDVPSSGAYLGEVELKEATWT